MKKGWILCILLMIIRCDSKQPNSQYEYMYLTFLHEKITVKLTDKETYLILRDTMPKSLTLYDNNLDQKYTHSLQITSPLFTMKSRAIAAYDVVLSEEGHLIFFYEDVQWNEHFYFIGNISEGIDSLTYMDEDMNVVVSFSD